MMPETLENPAPQTVRAGGRGGGRGGRPRLPGENYEQARTRKERALADKREDEVKQSRGKLHETEVCERKVADDYRMVRSGMLAVPNRVRARLPHLTAEDIRVLDEEIRAALKALGEGESESTPAP